MKAVARTATLRRISVIRFALSTAKAAPKNRVATIATSIARRLESTHMAASSGRRANAPTTTSGVSISATRTAPRSATHNPAKRSSIGLPTKARGLIKNRSGLSLVRFSWTPMALVLTAPIYPLLSPGPWAGSYPQAGSVPAGSSRLVRIQFNSVERSVRIRKTSERAKRIVQSASQDEANVSKGVANEDAYQTGNAAGAHDRRLYRPVCSGQRCPRGSDSPLQWICKHPLEPRDAVPRKPRGQAGVADSRRPEQCQTWCLVGLALAPRGRDGRPPGGSNHDVSGSQERRWGRRWP